MREILFRAKERYSGVWVYGALLKDNVFTYILSGNPKVTVGLHVTTEVQEVFPETVGQFTELTDKHGNKIFEGDVLQGDDIEDDIYHVVRIEQSDENRYECFLDFNGDNQCWLPFIDSFNRMKIIGNIHDNKMEE